MNTRAAPSLAGVQKKAKFFLRSELFFESAFQLRFHRIISLSLPFVLL